MNWYEVNLRVIVGKGWTIRFEAHPCSTRNQIRVEGDLERIVIGFFSLKLLIYDLPDGYSEI